MKIIERIFKKESGGVFLDLMVFLLILIIFIIVLSYFNITLSTIWEYLKRFFGFVIWEDL